MEPKVLEKCAQTDCRCLRWWFVTKIVEAVYVITRRDSGSVDLSTFYPAPQREYSAQKFSQLKPQSS